MAYDAFVSYRRSDRITADGVVRFLEAFGLDVFVDRSSRAGTAWEAELLAALASAKVLVVLWSRSAAQSGWVEREWRSVAPDCRVVPIKLDGEPLPDDLNRLTAVEGLDVGSRLLQRSFELMQQAKMSPAQAQEQLVKELAADGIVLEPQKREALGIFLGFVAGLAGGLALTQPGNLARARPLADSLPPSANTTPPPALGGRKLASLLGAVGVSAAAAFCVGYWWHESRAPTPTSAPECPPPPEISNPPAATKCPPATSCEPCKTVEPPACPCSREQCARSASPASGELRDTFRTCQKQLEVATRALNVCKQRDPVGRSVSTTAVRPVLAAGGSASTPVLR